MTEKLDITPEIQALYFRLNSGISDVERLLLMKELLPHESNQSLALSEIAELSNQLFEQYVRQLTLLLDQEELLLNNCSANQELLLENRTQQLELCKQILEVFPNNEQILGLKGLLSVSSSLSISTT